MRSCIIFLALCFMVTYFTVSVKGHARLLKPASRASLWRFEQFSTDDTPKNFDDNQLFCGGASVQYEQNGGNCGICGDSWDLSQPRPNEGGGKFGRGVITGEYKSGQIMDIEIDLTASHLGYFEVRLCPSNNPLVPVTQECLDKHVLPLANGSGTRYYITNFEKQVHTYQVKLPTGVVCDQCVLQWHYHTGNSYGLCESGTWELGCGNQENFRSCADIRITP